VSRGACRFRARIFTPRAGWLARVKNLCCVAPVSSYDFLRIRRSAATNIMKTNYISFRAWLAFRLACVLVAAMAFAGCNTMPSPTTEASVPATNEAVHLEKIILREGDVLKITFPGSPSQDTVQPIRRDGKINLNLVGEVVAAGLTPEELQKKLVDLYASQMSSKEITVQVQSSAFPVFVTGAVVKPGKIMSDHPITALEAVMEAGGFIYDTADLRHVRVIHNENGVLQNTILNLKAVLQGEDTKSFYLKPGDIVYVPERLAF
jgi:polysaccharide biosynthesis/export protein